MEMVIKKWGNSLAARIPSAIAKILKIDVNQRITMETKDGKLIITPVTNIKYDLDDLLKHCPPKAIRLDDEDRDWLNAEPAGKEEW